MKAWRTPSRARWGAAPLPDAFSAYSDGAWDYVRDGKLSRSVRVLHRDELKELNPSYLKEGQLSQASGCISSPIQKSSEALYLNWTAWEPFAAACGVTTDDLATWEGVTDVAAKYYKWSNGRHFFGRDAYANYLCWWAAPRLGEPCSRPTTARRLST